MGGCYKEVDLAHRGSATYGANLSSLGKNENYLKGLNNIILCTQCLAGIICGI